MSSPNIYQRINKVMQTVEYVQKDSAVTGAGANYKAVSHDQVISVARASLVENGILIFPNQIKGEFLQMRDINATPQPIKMGLYSGTYEIKEGHTVYANVPEHFLYQNKKGIFNLSHGCVTIAGELNYLSGQYIVTKTTFDGGSSGRDAYPDGHHVFCRKIKTGKSWEDNLNQEHEIDFYQSGSFTAMITNIKPIGKATLRWTIEPTT